MIDLDIYHTNKAVEEFLQLIKVKLGKDYPSTKVYISTTNPYNHWLKINWLKIKEEQKE